MVHPLDVARLLALPDGYIDREESEAVRLFAEANGAQFQPLVLGQPLPGVVFRDATGAPRPMQGAGRIVRFPGEPEIEIANSAFPYAIELNVMSSAWGYAAVRLPRPGTARGDRERPSRPAPAGDPDGGGDPDVRERHAGARRRPRGGLGPRHPESRTPRAARRR